MNPVNTTTAPSAIDMVTASSSVEAKPWTARYFLKVVGVSILLLLLLSMAAHVYLDIFGLFRDTKNRALMVYHNERPSKYLLSYRYIPDNFNTIIVGTSFSDNLDITTFNQSQQVYKVYNASLMGANITELTALIKNCVNGGVKNIVFCISPYQMKETGFKEMELNDKLYWGALGSKNLYETYAIAALRVSNVLPSKYSQKHINEYGVNFFTERYRVKDVAGHIQKVIAAHEGKSIPIEQDAVNEFIALITFLKEHNVNLLAYFHPIPFELYESKKSEHIAFQQKVLSILNGYGRVINFNEGDHEWFTKDYDNYIDNGHLSEQGQTHVASVLTESLKKFQ